MELKIEHLRFSYPGKEIFSDFSLRLKDGGVYLLTGPSGCGKTTLLHLLLGLLTPDAGAVTGSVRPSAVFQENRLLPGVSAVANLRFVGGRERDIRGFLAEILPEDCLDCPVEELSGGMARRVAIARALWAKSDLVIMDEPFTGLDKGTLDSVLDFIVRYRDGRTTVISSHHPEELKKLQPEMIKLI